MNPLLKSAACVCLDICRRHRANSYPLGRAWVAVELNRIRFLIATKGCTL